MLGQGPFIDMSDVILDPDLADHFLVRRRQQVISEFGRVEIQQHIFQNIVGVVTVSSPNDLERLDDQQRTGRHLTIVTKFALRATSPGFQPDLVVWRGDSYIVKTFDPYPQFGAGFYQAIVGSIDIQDRPAPGVGQFDFEDPAQAELEPPAAGG